MLLDEQALFSDRQAITASAASTNYINLGATERPPLSPANLKRDIGAEYNMQMLVQITSAFATLTSLTVQVQIDDNSAFSSPTTVATSPAIPVAQLVAGYRFPLAFVPRGTNEQYLRLNYVVTGSNATAGTVTAGIVAGLPS